MNQLRRDLSTESLKRDSSKYALQDKLLMSEDAHKIVPSLEKLNISKDYFNVPVGGQSPRAIGGKRQTEQIRA